MLLGSTPLPKNDDFWRVSTPREARARMLTALRLELLGPEAIDEALRESPVTKYTTGMLAPFGTDVPAEELDHDLVGDGGDEETGAVDLSAPISQSLTPSSIGLSFLVPGHTTSLNVRAAWGDYRVEQLEESVGKEQQASDNQGNAEDDIAEDAKRKKRRPTLRWIRSPIVLDPLPIELKPAAGLQRVIARTGDDVTIEHLSRRLGDKLAVSIFLVNRRERGERSRPPVDRWIFQPTLVVVGAISSQPIFLPRELEPASLSSDRDRDSDRLLFRDRREFAVGHGCAADWSLASDSSRASEVRTELVPVSELPRVAPRLIGGPGLEMRDLAEAESPAVVRQLLEPVLDAYERWIHEKRLAASSLDKDLRSVADGHLEDCLDALKRMRRGVDCLSADRAAFKAFQFANRAMLLQRSHSVWAGQRRRDPGTATSEPSLEGTWRPFQLAFILLNLQGLVDPGSDDRRIGDLLWFPTGGGKTEAYLGLTAFAMALRRQRVVGGMRTDAGVGVLMRYTLRLLTIQQFQRATALICACESLRKEEPSTWGERRFSIGLWLGMDGTPNTHSDSARVLRRLQNGEDEDEPSACVLESCPWCGEGLTVNDYWIDGDRARTRVNCPRASCAFSRQKNEHGLPVLVVDEEIYRECPSLLIATVDKFAQMPWNGDVQALFGFVYRECDWCGFLTGATQHVKSHRRGGHGAIDATVLESERLAPPELIIQDELHLITGPLGTLVGLYETAVDFLCSRRYQGELVGPKVIASTATVRRAFEQVQAVFDRKVKIFPPPALEPEDSFFAIEQPPSDGAPGRLYVGVSAPGKSMKTAYIRVAASLLSSGAGLRADPALAEPYATVVSYFNSLRELGGAIRLVEDDIPARLDQLQNAGLPRRNRPIYVELTSRIAQTEIPHLLRRLERRHDSPQKDDDPRPLDVVLASNMISVGVDIDRLGLMTVTGQPKTTAEYIQATSRVGRQVWGPGLVVTIYNWTRPRDLSHYERFQHYHATLYRSVEAVSATPFSSRALDRGLRAVFVGMARLGAEQLSAEEDADHFDPKDKRIAGVIEAFRHRADGIVESSTVNALVRMLKSASDEWWGYARQPLRYGWRSPNPGSSPDRDVLLRVADGGRVGHWPAPQSLREVEEHTLVRVLGLDA